MYLNNPLYQSQAHPGPFAFGVQFVEQAENLFMEAWFNTLAVVANKECQLFGILPCADLYEKSFNTMILKTVWRC